MTLGATRSGWALIASVCCVACLPTPTAETQWGEHFSGKPLRVVLLPASCSSVEGECEDEHVRGVSGITASELEFARYVVTDAEKLVMSARSREDVNVELSRFGEQIVELKSRSQVGSVFEDLSPAQRRALLAEAKAEAIVSVKIQLGASKNGQRANQVQVRAGLGDGGELAWVTRCSAISAWTGSPSLPEALETATHCALDRVLKGKP